jgi:hypothetical protein
MVGLKPVGRKGQTANGQQLENRAASRDPGKSGSRAKAARPFRALSQIRKWLAQRQKEYEKKQIVFCN